MNLKLIVAEHTKAVGRLVDSGKGNALVVFTPSVCI